MWWFIAIAVIGFIIYTAIKDRNEDVKTHVSNFGGMQTKYWMLIAYFTKHPSSKIVKLTSDNITISSPSMTVWIDYVSSTVEITFKSTVPIFGNISKKWKYPSSYSQELMIQEIENFLDWNMQNMKRITDRMNDL